MAYHRLDSDGWHPSLSERKSLDGPKASPPLKCRPLDADLWVVPHDATIVAGAVDVLAPVAELSFFGEHEKPAYESTAR